MGKFRVRTQILQLAGVALAFGLALDGASAAPPQAARATERSVHELTKRAAAAFDEGLETSARDLARKAYDLSRAQLGEDSRATFEAGEQLIRAMADGQEKLSLAGSLSSAATVRFGPDDRLSLRLRRSFALSVSDMPDDQTPESVRRVADLETTLGDLAADTARVYGPHHVEALRARFALGQYYVDHSKRPGFSPCDRWELARKQFLTALDLRRDQDFLHSPQKRPLEDLHVIFLSGSVAETYEGSQVCAEIEDHLEDEKRYKVLKESYTVRQFADARKFLAPSSSIRITLAASEAEFHADAGRPDEARRVAQEVALEARRRHRKDDPSVIELELKYLDCPRGQACSPEAQKRIGELVYAALQFGERRRPEPYELYAYTFLGEKFRYIDKGAWLASADAIFARSVQVRTKLFGVADARTAAQFHYEFRRDTPRFAAKAVEPARIVVAAIRARIAARGALLQSNADVSKERTHATNSFLALAETAWTAGGSDERGVGPLGEEAYRAIQDSISGTVSRALALSAAQRAAEERGLSEVARRRSDLADMWSQLDSEFVSVASKGGPMVEELRRKRDQVGRDAADVDRRLRSEFPDYFQFLSPEPIDVRGTQALLAPDEAILLVVPGNRGGAQIMAISATEFAWRRSSQERSKIDAMVDHLLWLSGADVDVSAATKRRWAEQAGPGIAFDRRLAFELYGQLVAPVEPVLKGKRHVFLVTGGSLSRLPFGILVAAPTSGDDRDPAALRSTPWFADAHSLAVLPSVRSLQLLRRRAAPATSSGTIAFAGFGDPALDGKAETRGGRSASGATAGSVFLRNSNGLPTSQVDILALRSMSRLPGTAIELENMRRLLDAPDTAVRLGEQATETAVKDADLSRVRVVAFATHGLIAGELRGGSEPGLVLTPPTGASEKDDGFLAASEVAGLRLGADWVILSACNTAAGGSEALGLSGLARAFFHAGARSLLVSHWPVRDDVASIITVEAIRLERENPALSRAEALQGAMRRIRNDTNADAVGDTWAHPNAWAPFSLVGDGAESRHTK